jgi:hypothetical protein
MSLRPASDATSSYLPFVLRLPSVTFLRGTEV